MPFLLDAAVVAAYVGAILAIGLTLGRRDRTLEGFAVGDRRIPWWAVLASILAAEISAATFLGAPGEGYALRNFTYAQLALGTVLARVIVGFVFIKPYYDFRVVSIYEFLEIRFGPTTRNTASAVFLATRALASGTRLYVAAVILVLAFESATGARPAPGQELAIYAVALVGITALTAAYTAAGGIKAVVWTDLIQACVMLGAMGTALGVLLSRIPGGWDGAMRLLQRPGDLAFLDVGRDAGGLWASVKGVLESEYTIWAAVFGSTFITMATHGTDQDMVQRMLTAKNHRRSRLALVLSGLADLPIVFAFLLIGVLLWVFYQTNPDPRLPAKNPHVFAWFILHEIPPGARGLLVAGILATAMGSLSTALNALATSFVKDWFLRPGTDDARAVRAVRWSTVGFAALLVAIGIATAWAVIVIPGSRIIPIVLGIFGYTYGSLLGVFLVGMLTRSRGSERGNLLAMACGLLVVAGLADLPGDLFVLAGGARPARPEWLPTIEFPWRIMFGTLTTLGVALLFRTPAERVAHARARREALAPQATASR
ncbi:MAG: sodium:solute symporter [Verrucomicrobiae bacterium]|nr:sodium:solute symporter [Verrucomicrobiae bacterium]